MRVFGHHHHNCSDPYKEAPVWALELGLIMGLILENQETIMADSVAVKKMLSDLTEDVNAETTAIGGIEQTLTNLQSIVTKLENDATNAQVDPAIVDQISALKEAVGANKSRILADIAANTPPAPPAA